VIFLPLAIFCFLIHWAIRRKDGAHLLLLYLVFFCFGLYGIIDFIVDVFYPTSIAQLLRWPTGSPFQFESGIANLSFGILGLLSIKFRGGFLLATLIGNTIWFWGDTVGHLIRSHGGMDLFSWADVIIPILIWVVYWLSNNRKEHYTPT